MDRFEDPRKNSPNGWVLRYDAVVSPSVFICVHLRLLLLSSSVRLRSQILRGESSLLRFAVLAAGLLVFLTLASPVLAEGAPAGLEKVSVRTSPGTKWSSCDTRTLAAMPEFKPGAQVPLSKYGGRMDRKEKATGFFHVAKVDGRWWMVDPEGCLFVSVGINTVNAEGKGIKATADFLHENGFNTLGCWSAGETFRKSPQPLPYCLRWNYMLTYSGQRKAKYPGTGAAKAIYPFDPEFAAFCEEHSKELERTRNDPWLMGHFIDNELPLDEDDIVSNYLKFPASDPCHQAAAKFMTTRKAGKPDKWANRAFLQLVVSEYYRQVYTAMKRHDPNHMSLGSRFYGKNLHTPSMFKAAGPYTDVISVNYYHSWGPTSDHPLDEWAELSGKPILITEWYARTDGTGGAGWYVKTEADRGKFYQHMAIGLLENRNCVGWHWFKYSRMFIGEDQNHPSVDLFSACKAVNTQVYPLVDFLGKK